MIGIYEDTDSLSACQPEFGLAPDICKHCRFFVTAPCVRSMDPRAANAVRSLSPQGGGEPTEFAARVDSNSPECASSRSHFPTVSRLRRGSSAPQAFSLKML